VQVRVFHNIARDEDGRHAGGDVGYQPGHPVVLVVEFSLAAPADQAQSMLDLVYHELNVDRPQQHWARTYRDRGNRSLSTGDVVGINELFYACASTGWTRLDQPPIQTVPGSATHGTTPWATEPA